MPETESAGSWIKARRTDGGGLSVEWNFDPSGSSALVDHRLLEKTGALNSLLGAGDDVPVRMSGFWPHGSYAGEVTLETDGSGNTYRLLDATEITTESG